MTANVQAFDITCPASTPASAAIEIQLFGAAALDLVRLTVVIPDGHSGLTGIALGYAHNAVIPYNAGAFLSGNDEVIHYTVDNQPPGVGWSAFVCNLDLQPHSWEIRCEFDMLPVAVASSPPAAISPQDILNAGAAILSGP